MHEGWFTDTLGKVKNVGVKVWDSIKATFNKIVGKIFRFGKDLKDKLITRMNNPPKVFVEFFNEQKNLKLINCFSNEGNKWDKSEIKLENNKLAIKFRDKFLFRRGRINCSLNDIDGWRWFGIQFTIKKLNQTFQLNARWH